MLFNLCVKKTINSLKHINYQLLVNRRCIFLNTKLFNKDLNNDLDELQNTDEENREYDILANKCFLHQEQTCFIIHPHIKWGPRKKQDTSAQTELNEAISLVNTLPGWQICEQKIVPVENIDKKALFGTGTLEKLKNQIRQNNKITAVFINVSTLRNKQITELQSIFGVTILDRYKIVMQILRQHATSSHAKLQVALAEIPYLKSQINNLDTGINKMLQIRQQKIKNSLIKLRSQRELLRNKRRVLNFPVVAIVGYTNVGKTSLIKSLTNDANLTPKNQLFATLDVTMHAGLLPSKIEVLYVDTVGFITDIPTNLIECFIATLEDAMLADVIIQVHDMSNENMTYQKKHVDSVLQSLSKQIGNENLPNRIINVGNKSDLAIDSIIAKNIDMILVSAKNLTGIANLKQQIETVLLRTTGRHFVTLRVPTGGDETRWLFKNAAVLEQIEDENDCEFQMLKIIITEAKLRQFQAYFVKG